LGRYLANSPKTAAIVVTHLYGLTADMKAITAVCKKFGVLIVEDCAQSFGASCDGKRAGSWGDAAAFSFYPTKNLAALGDGGMVAFKDSEACARARKIAQYGWSSRYEVELPDGINSRLDEIQAAVVLHRLSSVDSRNSRRRDILRRYAEAVTMPRRFIFEDSERCVAHLAVMRTPTRDRDRTVLNSFGIETAIHYPIPDHKQPAWRHLFEGVALPNTEAHCAEESRDSQIRRNQ
jgi:dTDP-4-amino-4,6-dideoxygalactose transaminase